MSTVRTSRPTDALPTMENDLVSIAEIATWLEVKPSTVATYHKNATRRRREGTSRASDLPAPDGQLGRPARPVWSRATLDRWIETGGRPGQGKGGGRPWPVK